ncbi:MAG: hypothetical protein A2Z83_02435 [Omnitrophica bacterium GWA2_52_8]|nr:MAG: hypothetical protein A2Z83_02435 [Omnitrophica bacterium GWA2_52_8]
MHFPLPFHQNARIVHEASECAAEQGKFWEFHDKVFQDPQKYKDEASLLAAGDELGLKKDAYRTCVQTKKYGGKIDANITKAKSMGVSGTPAFFINGAMISGAQPYEQFKAAVDRALDPSIPPPSAPAPAAPAKAQFQDLDSRPSQGPKNAPVTVIEVSDFHCPFCGKVKPALDQLMKDYNGKIRLVWMHYPLPMHKNARLVHEASECAAEQGKFWEFKEKVFANQQAYQDEASLKSLAKEIGLKEKNFSECVSTSRYKDKIEKDIKAAGSAGVNGTPSFFINGVILTGARPYDQFKAAVDNALNPGSAPPPAAAPARPKARPVTEEDIRGRPATGPDKASVTLIEVSDFHCPFCQRAVATLDQVMQKYEGKVRHIWLHFPLPFHKDAFRVHEAAECAARQGKFWEYKAKIFADSNQYKTDDALKALAAELKLKANDFSKCLESGQAKAAVEKDMETAASLGVSGTPSFLINGELLVGAKPLEEFSRVIDQKLNQ